LLVAAAQVQRKVVLVVLVDTEQHQDNLLQPERLTLLLLVQVALVVHLVQKIQVLKDLVLQLLVVLHHHFNLPVLCLLAVDLVDRLLV
jgi:hypothetical protein